VTRLEAIPFDCGPTPLEILLLRAALLRGDAALGAWETWRTQATRPLRVGSSRLLPAVYSNLRDVAPEDPWLDFARTEYLRARYSNLLRFDDAAPVLGALGESGVAVLLLKGAALVAAHHGDPGLRPMVDLDVMVKEEDAERAIALLLGRGYAPAAPVDAAARAIVHSVPFTRQGAPPFDLHWRAFELEEDRAIWDSAAEMTYQGVTVRVPGPADQLLHACVSGSSWDWDAPQRWVLDAMAVVRSSGDRLDWGALVARAIALRLSTSVHDALRFLREEFGAAIPGQALSALAAAPTTRRERHAARARRTRPDLRGPLMAIALRLDEHHRLVRRGAGPGGARGLLQVWRRSWDLPGLWLLPVHAAVRGARRALQLARHRLRS